MQRPVVGIHAQRLLHAPQQVVPPDNLGVPLLLQRRPLFAGAEVVDLRVQTVDLPLEGREHRVLVHQAVEDRPGQRVEGGDRGDGVDVVVDVLVVGFLRVVGRHCQQRRRDGGVPVRIRVALIDDRRIVPLGGGQVVGRVHLRIQEPVPQRQHRLQLLQQVLQTHVVGSDAVGFDDVPHTLVDQQRPRLEGLLLDPLHRLADHPARRRLLVAVLVDHPPFAEAVGHAVVRPHVHRQLLAVRQAHRVGRRLEIGVGGVHLGGGGSGRHGDAPAEHRQREQRRERPPPPPGGAAGERPGGAAGERPGGAHTHGPTAPGGERSLPNGVRNDTDSAISRPAKSASRSQPASP